jgi:acetyl esterase/lipase
MVLWLLLTGSVIMSLPVTIHGEQRDWLDIPYAGLSGKQKLNIFLPMSGDGPFPVIVSIHGGFNNGDKMFAPAPPVHGYAVVAVNFRSFSEAKFPAQIQDIKAAIRWVRANAKVYHFNPDKIAVWGESDGGYLAALAGTSGDVKELEDLSLGNPDESSRVQAVIDWMGEIDLFAMCMKTENGVKVPLDSELDWLESEFLGKKITDAPELVKAINPETYITPDDPPFFIQHGTADKEVPVRQSINFAAKLEKTLGKEKVTLDLLKGAGHRDPIFSTWDNLKKTLDFLDKYLK